MTKTKIDYGTLSRHICDLRIDALKMGHQILNEVLNAVSSELCKYGIREDYPKLPRALVNILDHGEADEYEEDLYRIGTTSSIIHTFYRADKKRVSREKGTPKIIQDILKNTHKKLSAHIKNLMFQNQDSDSSFRISIETSKKESICQIDQTGKFIPGDHFMWFLKEFRYRTSGEQLAATFLILHGYLTIIKNGRSRSPLPTETMRVTKAMAQILFPLGYLTRWDTNKDEHYLLTKVLAKAIKKIDRSELAPVPLRGLELYKTQCRILKPTTKRKPKRTARQ